MLPLFLLAESGVRRSQSVGCGGSFGCLTIIVVLGLIIYVAMRGRGDRPEKLGVSKRSMGSGPIAPHTFVSPYAKCPTCSAAGDKMKQQWDGLRKVTWTCGYCGTVAGIQELKDEELPPSARQRLGLDPDPAAVSRNDFDGPPGMGGSGVGGLLTGMMIGSMMGGHSHRQDGWGSSDSDSSSNTDGDWGNGDAGGDWGDSGGDSGGDWGDSGGGDGGGDW